MVIELICGTVNNQKSDSVHTSMTVRQCFEKFGVNYASGQVTLDGRVVPESQLDCTLDQLGAKLKSYLLVSMKTNNA